MNKRTIVTALIAGFFTLTLQAQAPAFPGAEGFARTTTKGGRGGYIYHVTNLKDSGTGSLRWALSQTGPRIVVFDVSGYIDLASDLKIPSNTTIAGQTAPGDGITLRYYTVNLSGDNIIVRFIRMRRGNTKNVNDGADAFWGRQHNNIIIDHCSMSWSIDETASFYDNKNFTLQWCTIAESLNNAGHNKGAHGYGGIWGGKGASFHHNLLAHHTNRNPRLNGARYGWMGSSADNYSSSILAEQVDLRNNVMYNWGAGNGAYGGMGGYHNIVNNYYKYGPATKNKTRVFQCSHTSNASGEVIPANIYGHFYINGNYMRDKGQNYDWNGVIIDNDDSKGTVRDTIKLTSPIYPGVITTHTANNTFQQVLAYAGASLRRDEVDVRLADEALNGIATYKGSVTLQSGIIDTQEDVEGYPALEEVTRPANFDTDKDGIPDVWEEANGLNPKDPTDGKTYTLDSKGYYTNVEVYLNYLVEAIMKGGNEQALSPVDEWYPAVTAPTGMESIKPTSKVSSISYHLLDGTLLQTPQQGINIRCIRFNDGTTHTDKVICR